MSRKQIQVSLDQRLLGGCFLDLGTLAKGYRDVVIRCDEGTPVYTKIIALLNMSEFVRCCFRWDQSIGAGDAVSDTRTDIQRSILSMLVAYFEDGEVEMNGGNIQELYIAANLLQVQPLMNECVDYL